MNKLPMTMSHPSSDKWMEPLYLFFTLIYLPLTINHISIYHLHIGYEAMTRPCQYLYSQLTIIWLWGIFRVQRSSQRFCQVSSYSNDSWIRVIEITDCKYLIYQYWYQPGNISHTTGPTPVLNIKNWNFCSLPL